MFRTWADIHGIVIRSMSGELSSLAKDANRDPPIEHPHDKVQRLTDEFWYARR